MGPWVLIAIWDCADPRRGDGNEVTMVARTKAGGEVEVMVVK